MADGVGLTDVGEELVAQAFALGRAFDKAGDIGEFKRRINGLLRVEQLHQVVHALIRHLNNADVGVDGRKRIVLRQHLGIGDRAEQSGLADIGQSDDSSSQ